MYFLHVFVGMYTQMQMQGACRPGGVGGETVLKFWLDILLSWPTWVRDKSILLLLDTLCMSAFNEPAWQKIIMDRMMENYRVSHPFIVVMTTYMYMYMYICTSLFTLIKYAYTKVIMHTHIHTHTHTHTLLTGHGSHSAQTQYPVICLLVCGVHRWARWESSLHLQCCGEWHII